MAQGTVIESEAKETKTIVFSRRPPCAKNF
jgi:hypothetical protein